MKLIKNAEFGGERPLFESHDLRLENVIIRTGESAIGVLISECVHTFILHEEEILKGEFQGTLIQKLSSRVREAYENCSHTAFEKIYCSKDVVDIELAGWGWGYSCLTMIDKETVGILYESSVAHMTFQAIKLKDIIKTK